MEKITSTTLELHYYLTDENKHSINAVLHNECEKYFLQALLSLNKYFENPIKIEITVKEKGGFKDLVKVIALGLATNIIYDFGKSFFAANNNAPDEILNRIEIVQTVKNKIKSGEFTELEFDYIAKNDRDLRKLKSEYFKSVQKDKTIKSIEISKIEKENNKPIFLNKISYNDFNKCILSKEEESDVEEIDATIYIVAPVLIEKRRDNWKGIHNKESINFEVTDDVFLKQVYNQSIKFSHGTYIVCKMRITTTQNITDATTKISRNVFEVYSIGDDSSYKYELKRKNKKINNEKQLSLFNE